MLWVAGAEERSGVLVVSAPAPASMVWMMSTRVVKQSTAQWFHMYRTTLTDTYKQRRVDNWFVSCMVRIQVRITALSHIHIYFLRIFISLRRWGSLVTQRRSDDQFNKNVGCYINVSHLLIVHCLHQLPTDQFISYIIAHRTLHLNQPICLCSLFTVRTKESSTRWTDADFVVLRTRKVFGKTAELTSNSCGFRQVFNVSLGIHFFNLHTHRCLTFDLWNIAQTGNGFWKVSLLKRTLIA